MVNPPAATRKRSLFDEADHQTMPLVERPAALVELVIPVERSQRIAVVKKRARPAADPVIQLVAPRISQRALEAAREAPAHLHRQCIVVAVLSVLHLVDA